MGKARRAACVEAKLYRARELVNVLAARARCANEAFLQLAIGDADVRGDLDHGVLVSLRLSLAQGSDMKRGPAVPESYSVEETPSGRPATVTKIPLSRRRLATRLASASVTASIRVVRRSM